jgi:hypothetical protein
VNVTEPSAFTFDNVRQVNVFAVSGSVRVAGTDSDRAHVEISELEHGPIRVERHRNGILDVRHPGRTWRDAVASVLRPQRQPRAVLSIAAPRDCPVNLWLVSADAAASGLRGSLEVHGGRGAISLTDLTGFVRVSSHSGGISVAGDAGIAPRSVRLSTHSGGVTVDDLPASRGHLSISTHGGDVLLTLPQLADAMVDIGTTSGRIDSQFAEVRPTGPRGARVARGILGPGGGSSLSITTHSGDVTLVRRVATVVP